MQNPQSSPVVETFLVPYELNPHFTGRKVLLQSLRRRLCEVVPKKFNHRIALHGLGGVGKTQMALAYVYAHELDYDAIYWITGANQASILSSFQDIAKRTGLLKSTESTPDDVAKSVLSKLNSQTGSWLVVIDNLDDVSAVNGYLPHVAPGKHTIITTRNPNTYEIPAEGIELGVLGLEDAIELLIIRSNIPAKVDATQAKVEATQIVQELGFLPLAIEQAGAYIYHSKNIFRFLPSYRSDRKKYLKWIPKGNWQYSEAVATTWHLSFQQVEKNCPVASTLLRLLAFLNPDGILLEFLEAGKDGLPIDLRELVSELDELYESLIELERYSLVRRENDGEEERVTIHRLVQAVIKDEMSEHQFSDMEHSVIKLFDHAFPQHWDSKPDRLLCRRFEDQAVATLSGLKTTDWDDLEILARIAKFLHDDGKFKQAGDLRLKLVNVSITQNGVDHPRTLRARAELAETYHDQKRWDEALELREKIRAAAITVFGDENEFTLKAMGNLASSYRSKGRLDDAVKLQLKVLEVQLRLWGDEHPESLRAMGNLAATYRSQKCLDEATKLQQKVLDVRLRTLGEDHPDTLRAMSNLAVTYRQQKHYVCAAELQEKLVKYSVDHFGDEHPATLKAMDALGATRYHQRRWSDAAKLQENVLRLRERVMGDGDTDTMWAMANLVLTYWKQQRLEEAEKLQQRLVDLWRRELGNKHDHTLRSEKRLEKIQRNRKDASKFVSTSGQPGSRTLLGHP
jgi:tetratricopeptide (TPR) repeat protein